MTDHESTLMSPQQRDYIIGLARKVHGPRHEAFLTQLRAANPRPSKRDASEWIRALKGAAESEAPRSVVAVAGGDRGLTAGVRRGLASARVHGLRVVVVMDRPEAERLDARRSIVEDGVEVDSLVLRPAHSSSGSEPLDAILTRVRAESVPVHAFDDDPRHAAVWASHGVCVSSSAEAEGDDPFAKPPAPTTAAAAAHARIPEGRYALGEGDAVEFFQVDRPATGKWAGFTFVSRLQGDASTRVQGEEKAKILASIGRSPLEAAQRYGKRTLVCGRCGRRLTNPDSLRLGIGPECLRKMG